MITYKILKKFIICFKSNNLIIKLKLFYMNNINNKSIWISWSDLKSKLKGKTEIFLFGKSQNLIPKTIKKLKFSGKISIIDNNRDLEGRSYFDLKILDEKKFLRNKNKNKKIFIIICVEHIGNTSTIRK